MNARQEHLESQGSLVRLSASEFEYRSAIRCRYMLLLRSGLEPRALVVTNNATLKTYLKRPFPSSDLFVRCGKKRCCRMFSPAHRKTERVHTFATTRNMTTARSRTRETILCGDGVHLLTQAHIVPLDLERYVQA